MKARKDIYIINTELLNELRPDVIVAQSLCEVCSPYLNEISRAREVLINRVIMLDPHDIDSILDSMIQLAEEFNIKKRGVTIVKELKRRINIIHQSQDSK